MNTTSKMTQAMTADDREQRRLEIWREYCHAVIEAANFERLWRVRQMMSDDISRYGGGNRELEIARKSFLSWLEIADERKVMRVARMLADWKEAERLEDQKLFKDLDKLEAEGYVPQIQ